MCASPADKLHNLKTRRYLAAAAAAAALAAPLPAFPLCRQRLEAELASRSASLEDRQHAAALLAAQQAELQAYGAEVEREQQEQLAMEQRIRAMESKASWRPSHILWMLPSHPPNGPAALPL